MIEFALEEELKKSASIKVLGIGGAGGNTVNSLIDSGHEGIECIVANTDAQALEHAKARQKIQIGVKTTKGLGTGANPELGQRSAEEDLDKIMDVIGDADIVFLTAGMGGGTGSGAVPVVARALKEHGILSIAVVTKPFLFEGKRRARVADAALEQLKKDVDTLIVVPNQKLIEVVAQEVSMLDAFAMINEILTHSVKGVSDIITKPGHINVDFADVRAIMKDMGLAVLGTGRAQGKERALEAAFQAISSPLLENMSIDGARGVLLNITGGPSLGLHEISQAASIVYERADEDANIILGSVIDPAMGNEVSVTLIATGFVNRKVTADQSTAALEGAVTVQQALKSQLIQEEKRQAQALVEELVILPEAAVVVEEPIEKVQEHTVVATENRVHRAEALDLDDLDVPAYLRKERAEKSHYRIEN